MSIHIRCSAFVPSPTSRKSGWNIVRRGVLSYCDRCYIIPGRLYVGHAVTCIHLYTIYEVLHTRSLILIVVDCYSCTRYEVYTRYEIISYELPYTFKITH